MASNWMQHASQVNYHSPQITEGVLYLAGMHCLPVEPADLQPGDLAYHYSSQLDAYTIIELTRVEGRKTSKGELEGVVIDSDLTSEIGGIRRDGFSYYTFWRASPAERLRVERDGFEGESDFISLLSRRENMKRQLTLKLYYRTRLEKIRDRFKQLVGFK